MLEFNYISWAHNRPSKTASCRPDNECRIPQITVRVLATPELLAHDPTGMSAPHHRHPSAGSGK